MTLSIISVVLNGVKTLEATIQSVLGQNYRPLEYCIIDGGSVDGSLGIIQRYAQHLSFVSEPDRGLYDAMNKGIARARGEIIGILNSDDIYAHPGVLAQVVQTFESNPEAQMVYADLVYVKDDRIVRHYVSGEFSKKGFFYGRVPAHPTLFVRKGVYEHFGGYKIDYKISADYEFLLRTLYVGGLKVVYVPQVWVKMGVGGVSTRGLKSLWIANQENLRACQENGIKAHWGTMLLKYPYKIQGLFKRPTYSP
ncbi:glycosyltransferase family 2 protein [Helicobacter salomonis]|uniref:glycosyltransferase family 2 protein n=1 Tax=Helicobacter salomonis TaxID=56878 RepID=UPI000CF01D5B|nr:glycosyltransferase family 2 protein [Helicobacter salomonis]